MSKKRGLGWRGHLFTIVGLVCAVLFAPTTVILVFGMLPTLAANLIDKTIQKSRAISVGMMNFAGCMPFLLELWLSPTPNDLHAALNIIIQPKTGIIIYVIAAAGYAIEAAVTGMVSTLLQQRAQHRLTAIEQRKEDLIARWDQYVDGEVPLDDFGFPKHAED
jgi:hypothetical protein